MIPRLWSTTHNGGFKIVSLTADTLQPAISLMKSIFFKYETTSKVFGIQNNVKAINELTNLALETAKDGISLVAQDTQNGEIASVLFNKILVRNEKSIFEKHLDQCRETCSKEFLQFMIVTDKKYNIFDHYDHDCGIEFMFAVTNPKYSRKQLALDLIMSSVDMAKMLAKRQNVKISLRGEEIPLEDIPKFIVSSTTASSTKNIAKKLGFTIIYKFNYKDHCNKDQIFTNNVGNIPESYDIVALDL